MNWLRLQVARYYNWRLSRAMKRFRMDFEVSVAKVLEEGTRELRNLK